MAPANEIFFSFIFLLIGVGLVAMVLSRFVSSNDFEDYIFHPAVFIILLFFIGKLVPGLYKLNLT
jgi:hypothetical protein